MNTAATEIDKDRERYLAILKELREEMKPNPKGNYVIWTDDESKHLTIFRTRHGGFKFCLNRREYKTYYSPVEWSTVSETMEGFAKWMVYGGGLAYLTFGDY